MRADVRGIVMGAGLAIAFYGCGGAEIPELASVEGTVKLDGKPLAGVIIVAFPEVGRPATANVDEFGHYELQYKKGIEGTKLGKNRISFTWPTGASGPAIPAKYGEQSQEMIEVKEGVNTFDFDMVSDPPPDKAKTPQRTPPVLD
jgi:hypothetical protein